MYYSSNNEAVQQYLAKVTMKSLLSFGRNRDILNAVLTCLRNDGYDYYGWSKKQNDLYSTLWTRDTVSISNIFSGSESKVLVTLLGKEWAEKFKKIWDRSSNYIYTSGVLRRSFRSKKYDVLYLSTAVSKLLAMINLVANDFSYEKYFSKSDNTFAYNIVIPDLLALEIDEGNEAVTSKIHYIVYGDNNTGLVTHEIIKGMLMSRNSKAHKWVSDLLLAAKLQEGLRQAIVESMDESSKEGFVYILKTILDNDLIRFSSVVRALDVWTGLGISAEKPSVIKKCLETGYKCLTEPKHVDNCLNSDDNMLIYMGLWSIAFDDVMDTESRIKAFMSADEKYKRLVALYFLKQTQFARYQHKVALPLLDDPNYEVKCWVLTNLFSDENHMSFRPEFREQLVKYRMIEGICSSEQLFYKLKDMLDNMPKKEIVYKESVFPWCQASVTCDEIIVKMLLTLQTDTPENIIDMMLDYRDKMGPDTRSEFIEIFLNKPGTEKQKTAIVEFMGDKSSYVRDKAIKLVEKLKLTQDDYRIIEDLLRYKSGDLRKNAITMLLRQSPEALLDSIKRLFEDKNENKHLAALDIISSIENELRYKKIVQECREMAAALLNTSQKTKVLAEKIINVDAPVYTAAEGFGLFNSKQEIHIPEISYPKGFSSRSILASSLEEIKRVLKAFSDLIDKHKTFEYEVEDWDGEHRKVVLGGEYNIRSIRNRIDRDKPLTIDDYPLPDIWREAREKHELTAKKLLEILFYFEFNPGKVFSNNQLWFDTLILEMFPINNKEFEKVVKDMPFIPHTCTILNALFSECPKAEVFELCRDMSCYIYKRIPYKRFAEDYEKRDTHVYYYGGYNSCLVNAGEISYWYNKMKECIYDDQSFKEAFNIGYAFYKASSFKSHANLHLSDFEKAFNMGLVDENELYTELCGRPLSAENLRALTNAEYRENKYFSSCQKLREVCNKTVDRIVSIELKRGDMTTEVSHLAAKIYKCIGIRFFVDILVGAEKDTYVRGYNFVGDDSTKKQIFSHLLKCCYPADGENEETLRQLLKNVKVTDKQLIDAAMYSPQWLEIVEKYLGWSGLKSACWYFHAHVNETFSKEKEAIVVCYSPISPQDFKDGAFDIDWFNEAYKALGEKRFKVVYDSAKYIAGGGLHRRAQLFVDSVLGKIDINQAEKMINEKRNKDYVLCYGLIPLENGKIEMLHRFEFLQGFLKESKQFGAQRRESEGKAFSISLDNLARNAGFADVSRFTWYMETEKFRSIEQYLKPLTIGDVEICISINELGIASINITKDGKSLKDIPSKLKDNEYVKNLKAIHKSLKSQHSRARIALEKAMETGDMFTVDELENLSDNPVIYPLIKNLVFKAENKMGYFKGNALESVNGLNYEIDPKDKCIIAHPFHMYESGAWAAYQKDVFNRTTIQPFKQVFRELYRFNEDEAASCTISRRYDGHQIQPQKAAALLNSRGWTASYGEGLRKVIYKENIIAEIYAMADWFSPADVEAPVIEGIAFSDRRTGRGLNISDIPGVIFSEIMRDVDLVVSVAHVGGVDPEASLSTIEMRIVIFTEMLRLLKLTNVELKGSHAFVSGTLGQYTVHLGSGVVHKMAKGALNIIPVHSQHRGRIFLPFMDDDPKTAEILSKVVMLAEDNKIKDPTILSQIAN